MARQISISAMTALVRKFQAAGISTSFDQETFKSGGGWLSKLSRYTFSQSFTIEGPCGFFGGVYGPNPWAASWGLCQMGACSYSHSPLPEGLGVGRYCSLGKGLRFLDFAHPSDWATTSVPFFRPQGVDNLSSLHAICEDELLRVTGSSLRRQFDPKEGKRYPTIQHDVWMGENVALAMGITIGTGAIIASGAIVTKDVPPYAVVAGVPAAVKKMRFDEVTIAALLESEWWNYDFVALSQFDVTNPLVFARSVSEAVANRTLLPWRPKCVRIPDDLLELSQGVGDMG